MAQPPSQPPIDRANRPSETRGPWTGIVIAAVAVAMLVVAGLSTHSIWMQGSNWSMSEPSIVAAVTQNTVKRPQTSAPVGDANVTPPGSGQADCPT